MESPDKERVHEVVKHEDGAVAFFVQMTSSGSSDHISRITDLQLIIDGSTWTDSEDDAWAIALRTFAPLSDNLEHLHIIIQGKILFTRFNYIKPALYTMVPYGIPEASFSDLVDHVDDDGDGDDDDDDDKPHKDDHRTSSSSVANNNNNNNNNNKKPKPKKRLEELVSPEVKSSEIVRYSKRVVPPDTVPLHITGEKAIISALLSLRGPVARVTIQGYVQLDLRRQLIEALNPGWRDSAHCLAQWGHDDGAGGGSGKFSKAVDEAERFERAMVREGAVGLVRIASAQRDDADGLLGAGGPGAVYAAHENTSYGSLVPTSLGGRQVYGWRAAGVHAWKGPPPPAAAVGGGGGGENGDAAAAAAAAVAAVRGTRRASHGLRRSGISE